MKLELKHLAGYLPYGLKMTKNGFVGELEIINRYGELKVSCSEWWENEYKPILRPLSDLTKEIEVNGEKFVPINLLEIERQSKTGLNYISFFIVEKLLEWHFDIYGLIENDLAIDKNTL